MTGMAKDSDVSRALRLLVAVAAVTLSCLYATAGTPSTSAPSTTKPVDKTLVVEKELMAELKDCPQTEPDRAKKLIELFKQAGLKDIKTQEFDVDEEKGCKNVIATLPGKSKGIIVIGAHLDFIKKGKGVVDNWSGVAMMANVAQALAHHENQHTFVFVGFDLEEKGMWGSQYFIEKLEPEQRERIVAMVNIDSMGVSALSVLANDSADDLESLAAKVAKDNSMKLKMRRVRLAGSDAVSFMEAGIPALSFVGMAFRDIKIIHSENDQFKRIRARRYVAQYQYIVKFVRIFDAHKKVISVKNREDSLEPAEIGISPDVGAAGDEGCFIIDGVVQGSAEEKAGMKVGDIIVCIPAEKIKSVRLVAAYLLCLNEGDKVTFKIKRGEKILELTVQY